MRSYRNWILSYLLVSFAINGHAQDVVSSADYLEHFGVDVDAIEIDVETLAPGLHVLFGAGGNIAVSIGDQGVLIVDDQFPQLLPKIKTAITELGGGDIDFVINTHWHFDHADGNTDLGSGGSWIVSQANSRRMMQGEHQINLVTAVVEQPAYPAVALPVMTFEDRMQVHFNGEDIDLLHFGPAHTTGDAAVYFRGSNVIHMGDVYNAGYPFIDADNGGDLNGVISFCRAVMEVINEETTVVPGHGRVSSYQDLSDFTDMLVIVRDRVAELIVDGASLEEVIAAKPTAQWDELRGDPTLLLNRAYASLKR
jgi:cyclase